MKYGSYFDVILQDTDEKGRGLFADEQIPADSKIFSHLVTPIPENELVMFKQSFLRWHLIYWDKTFAIGLGDAMYLNHSDQPNVKFIRHFDDNLLEGFSLVSIEKGTELTHKYANPQRHPLITGSAC